MKIGDTVRATKVFGKPDATLKTGHEVEGVLVAMSVRGPLNIFGELVTTPIELLTFEGERKAYAHTKNSLWRIEAVE